MPTSVYSLAHIALAEEKQAEFVDLFVRKEGRKYVYNTWMNVFAAKKYYNYAQLGELYLRIQAEGAYVLEVIGNRRNDLVLQDEVLVSKKVKDATIVHVPSARDYDGVYFTIRSLDSSPVNVYGGEWCTDVPPVRENKMAIVSCTFKREEYIMKNVSIFERFIEETPELKNRIKLWVIDNGRTIPESIKSENVELFYNKNAGGAGGFTRGVLEVQKANEGFTRILFMDDDVEFFAESFYRTLKLTDYLKEEYRQAFVNGAMLDLQQKNMFIENLALQDELWVRAYHDSCCLSYANILKVNDIPDAVFHNPHVKTDSAWWYSCFDLSLIEQKGLPLPVFFRGDDLEWGWRNFGNTHISLNGICVWHSSFVFRVSKMADYYFLPRNMFMINAIYTENFKKVWKMYFEKKKKYLLATYDYTSLEMLTQALVDILKGDAVYREDPELQLKRIAGINCMSDWRDCASEQEKQSYLHPRKHKVKSWRKFLYKITGRGIYCPKIFMKKRSVVLDWYPAASAFIMTREVKVYNPLSGRYELRKFDASKQRKYQSEINSLLAKIEERYDELESIFKQAHKEFSSEQFWKDYLSLDS